MLHPLPVVFMVLWFLLVVLNAASCYCTHVKKRYRSPVPLLGGVFGVVGFYLLPALRKWCWVPVLLDYGTIAFLLVLPKVVKEFWQISRINLVREFAAEEGGKKVRIALYRAGVFVIEHQFRRARNEVGLLTSSDLGRWSERDQVLVLTLRGDSVTLRPRGGTWRIDRSFSHYPKDGDLEIHQLDFKEAR